MNPARDIPKLAQPWHLDCRIESELPEDKVVGTRFLTHAIVGGVTGVALVAAAWAAALDLNLRSQIRHLNDRLQATQGDMKSVKQLQADYQREATKIDHAYALMHMPLFVSHFLAELGRTRPERMTIDIVESTEPGTAFVRGTIRETAGRASLLLGEYVENLRKNPKIGPACRDIRESGMTRSPASNDVQSFEITFRLR